MPSCSNAYSADVTVTNGHIHVTRLCLVPRYWLARSQLPRQWLCAGLLTLRWVLAKWGACGLPVRLGAYRALRRFSRLLQ